MQHAKIFKIQPFFMYVPFVILFATFLSQAGDQAFAQPGVEWEKFFGQNGACSVRSVQQTSAGGYILAGSTLQFPNEDVYVLKLNERGEKQWEKTFRYYDRNQAFSISQTKEGGYIIAGETEGSGHTADALIMKLNSEGEKIWIKTFGGEFSDSAVSIQETVDNGYIMAGKTFSFGAGGGDMYVFKLNSNGEKVWQKTFGGKENDQAESIQQTRDGGYIVAGRTESFGDKNGDVLVIKLNPDGTKVWSKTYGGKSQNHAFSVQQTNDGKYIVAGYSNSFGGVMDFYVLKLLPDGKMEWEKTFGGESTDWAYSIKQTKDGEYIVAGWTKTSFESEPDVLVIKLDQSGEKLWGKTIGGKSLDQAYSIQQTTDGGYIIAGRTQSFSEGKEQAYVIKTAPERP